MAEAESAEGEAPLTMPPQDESGFPALPMFGAECGELYNSCQVQRLVMLSTTLPGGLAASGMGALGPEQSQLQVGTQYMTRAGVLKAEFMSAGMLQTAFEGFSPLPFLQLNTQLAFCGQGLAMGVLQGLVLTPVGMIMGCANVMGQLSAEMITAIQPTPSDQLLLGAHAWGTPGSMGGVKGALEWQHQVLEGEGDDAKLVAMSAITLAVTAPYVTARGAPLERLAPSWALHAFHRPCAAHSLAASFERGASGKHVLTAGGTRTLSETSRLRSKFATTGVLGLALEVAGTKSNITFTTEANALPGAPLNPRFGAAVSLSPGP